MAQKTFLEICQRAARECGIHHTATQLPTTVVNQTGELLRMVEWVSGAWFKIQAKNANWRFKRQQATFATVLSQAEYTLVNCGLTVATFQRWDIDSFRNYETAVGLSSEQFMDPLDYDDWRNIFKFGPNRTATARPTTVTVLPNNGIGLGLAPLAGYTILGDYYTAPIRMTADAEIPELPESQDYMLIVYEAMKEYALYESAPEVLARADDQSHTLMNILERDQLPQTMLGGCLS